MPCTLTGCITWEHHQHRPTTPSACFFAVTLMRTIQSQEHYLYVCLSFSWILQWQILPFRSRVDQVLHIIPYTQTHENTQSHLTITYTKPVANTRAPLAEAGGQHKIRSVPARLALFWVCTGRHRPAVHVANPGLGCLESGSCVKLNP